MSSSKSLCEVVREFCFTSCIVIFAFLASFFTASIQEILSASITNLKTLPETLQPKHHLNIVLAGHISSDNLGLNLLFDKLEKKFVQKLEFVECSGFRRFRR